MVNEKELREKIKFEEDMILRTQNEIKIQEQKIKELNNVIQQRFGRISAYKEIISELPRPKIKEVKK